MTMTILVALRDYHSTMLIPSQIDIAEAEATAGAPPNNRPCGFCCRLGGDWVGIFAVTGRLFLSINGRGREVARGEVSAMYFRRGERKVLLLKFGDDDITIRYRDGRMPVSTSSYSEVEEDADFGLWLCNILGSAERRGIFIEAWDPADG